jgi:hypothetical protein
MARGKFSRSELPSDLLDFDPTYDPLAADRPSYDLAAASGRYEERVWGAIAPKGAAEISEWSAHLQSEGITRVLGLFTEQQAAARSPDGTATGYMAALVEAGFDPNCVALLDPRTDGAREVIYGHIRAAADNRENLCVHCADGNRFTAVPMADWLLTDYIGGENYLEACSALEARKRLAGVGRTVDAAMLEAWMTEGRLTEEFSTLLAMA